jgi:hypothetical protein
LIKNIKKQLTLHLSCFTLLKSIVTTRELEKKKEIESKDSCK